MQFLLLGLVFLVLLLLVGRALAGADTKTLAKTLRSLSGWSLLGIALFLLATGKAILALPIGLFALSLLGFSIPGFSSSGQNSRRTQGQRSQVRTDLLEMSLNHDTGEMDGVVRKGRFEGKRLSQLSTEDLRALLQEAQATDAQAAQLLEAYIARFRQQRQGGRRSGQNGASPGPMTVEEAYAVLGLKPGATRDDVLQAHRGLMKKYHPDQGGTTYLATKINEAKDILLEHAG